MAKQTKEVKKPTKQTKSTKVETQPKKGKLSLLETTPPEDIIYTDEEVGNIPCQLIDDEYGIATCYDGYCLVERKSANKTGKEENGEDPTKVYNYFRWEEIKYPSTKIGVVEAYCKIKGLKLNSKYVKSKDFQNMINTENEIKAIIEKAFNIETISEQVKEICNLSDDIQQLKNQIAKESDILKEVIDVKNKAIEEIKKVKMAFMDRERPKTHRIKEEE